MGYKNAKDYFGEDIPPAQDAAAYFGETQPTVEQPSGAGMLSRGAAVKEMLGNFPGSFTDYIGNVIKGVQGIPKMAAGGLQNPDPLAPEKAVTDIVRSVGSSLKERYGSLAKAKETIVKDPVGTMADLSMFYAPADPSRLVTGPAKALGKVATETLPKWAYKSATKMGTGSKLSIAERNRRAATGLEEAIMPTEAGSEKIMSKVSDIDSQIQGPITEAAQAGVTIPRGKVAERLYPTFEEAATQVNPYKDMSQVAKVERNFISSTPKDIPIDVAQQLKKGTYSANKKAYGTKGGFEVEAEKSLARGLKEEIYSALEQKHPQLKALGEKEGSLIALKESIDSAVKRIQNTEGMPLRGSIAASAGNAPMTIASLLELPRIKAALAIALFKAGKSARKIPTSTLGKLPPYAYGVGKYTEDKDE